MLMITRNVGESFRIGDDISVCILDVNGMQVKIGIDAPKNVAVHREEIYQRIKNDSNIPKVKFKKSRKIKETS